MNRIALILIILFLTACGDKSKRNIIPRKDLVPMLVDLHIADAIALDNSVRDMLNNPDSASIYESVFRKYGYEKWQFDSTMKYYVLHTKKYRSIYDEVFAELSRRENKIKSQTDIIYKRKTDIVWNQKQIIEVKGDSSRFPRDFIIPIDSTGKYAIHGRIRMDKSDQSKDPVLQAYFFSGDSVHKLPRIYFPEAKIYKTKYLREYLITKTLNDTAYKFIGITPVKNNNTDTFYYKNTQISNFRVHRYKE